MSGADDRYELVGRIERAFLVELGAEVLENSMILGDNAYDVVQGFVGAPIGNFGQYASVVHSAASAGNGDDAELLARFVRLPSP